MTINKILKQLTPGRVKKEIEAIQRIKLPPELQKWVREYKKVGERKDFIWKWLYKIIPTITFSSVSTKYKNTLINNKFLISMFVFILDDVIDVKKNKNLLDKLSQFLCRGAYIKTNDLNKREKEHFEFIVKLWIYIKRSIKKYPRFREFQDVFYYDIAQILNSMDYAYLVNKNFYLINKTEYWLYFPNSMQGMVYSTLDLMCSPKFNIEELGITRRIIYQAQKMIRIGNWLSSWERELIKNDLTSGVFAYAIDLHILKVKELKKVDKTEIIKRIKESNIKKNLLKEWERYSYNIIKISRGVTTINIKGLLSGLKNLLKLELIGKYANDGTFFI